MFLHAFLVLVPFDIGVVYIDTSKWLSSLLCFSPLRYWGGLYHKEKIEQLSSFVLVPFDIGVVYIYNDEYKDTKIKF